MERTARCGDQPGESGPGPAPPISWAVLVRRARFMVAGTGTYRVGWMPINKWAAVSALLAT
jgi:hypothetical protein